jgi:hypothetical protein
MKPIIIIITLIFCVSLRSCIRYIIHTSLQFTKTIEVKNNSDNDIYVCHTCSDSLITNQNIYVNGIRIKDNFVENFIEKDTNKLIHFTGYKDNIHNVCKDKHIRFFFINDSVFRDNLPDIISKHHLYEKKILFSDEDLKKMNYTIIYEDN